MINYDHGGGQGDNGDAKHDNCGRIDDDVKVLIVAIVMVVNDKQQQRWR